MTRRCAYIIYSEQFLEAVYDEYGNLVDQDRRIDVQTVLEYFGIQVKRASAEEVMKQIHGDIRWTHLPSRIDPDILSGKAQ